MAAAKRRASPGLDEGGGQASSDAVGSRASWIFPGFLLFSFSFLFYTRYARPAVERRTPPTYEHIVHHGGNGWRETGGRGQVKTEPVTSETVAAAECGDAELLKLVLCSACGCS